MRKYFGRSVYMALAALFAASPAVDGGWVRGASAESVERSFQSRVRSQQPITVNRVFNWTRGSTATSSDDQAATTSVSSDPAALENSGNPALEGLSKRTEIFSWTRSVAPILNARSEAALQNAVQRYERIVRAGGWNEVPVRKTVGKGAKGRIVEAIRARLAMEGYLSRASARGDVYDNTLVTAVRGFQENYGLPETGKVDRATAAAMSVPAASRLETIRANLIRLPEYTKDLSRRYITVNIPAAKLEAVEGNRVVSRHAVIVGKPERPSPVVMSRISEINFNPYWHAPKSIVEKDIVPEVRKNRRKLKELQIRIYDGFNGPEVDPASINWHGDAAAIAERYHFRQEPGGINAMASVKINFRNKHAVYMHDTPTKQLFNESARYFSSGCVRVEDVHQLTSWLLNGQDGWNLHQIRNVAKSEERVDVSVRDGIDVRWVYLTAWAGPDGMVRFRDDIYSLDGTGFITGQPIGLPEEQAG